jgi:hypothetical protein
LSGSGTIKLVYDLAHEAINTLNSLGMELYDEIIGDADSIIKAINFHDKTSVKYIMDKYCVKEV